jgi:hypothetical protein
MKEISFVQLIITTQIDHTSFTGNNKQTTGHTTGYILSTLINDASTKLSPDYPENISSSNCRNLEHRQVASKFSPSTIEFQQFFQTWWTLKVQLLLALIVMTWAGNCYC